LGTGGGTAEEGVYTSSNGPEGCPHKRKLNLSVVMRETMGGKQEGLQDHGEMEGVGGRRERKEGGVTRTGPEESEP